MSGIGAGKSLLGFRQGALLYSQGEQADDVYFKNKFRRLGLIDYKGEIHVHPDLLTDIVLTD